MNKLLIPVALLSVVILGLSASATPTAQVIVATDKAIDTSTLEEDETAVGGARGGPEAELNANGTLPTFGARPVKFYDSSEAAKASYLRTWVYEAQLPADMLLQERDVYLAGIAVCAIRYQGRSSEAAASAVERQFTLNKAAAAGTVVSAQLNLCTPFANNYLTQFDRYVNQFMSKMRSMFPSSVQAGVADYGYYMKSICWHYRHESGNGTSIYNDVIASAGTLTLAYQLTRVGMESYANHSIKQAVIIGCYDQYDKLPYELKML